MNILDDFTAVGIKLLETASGYWQHQSGFVQIMPDRTAIARPDGSCKRWEGVLTAGMSDAEGVAACSCTRLSDCHASDRMVNRGRIFRDGGDL